MQWLCQEGHEERAQTSLQTTPGASPEPSLSLPGAFLQDVNPEELFSQKVHSGRLAAMAVSPLLRRASQK